MSVILNETKQAEDILMCGEVGNKPTSTLFLLGKYYRQKEGLDKNQTISKLNEFMSANYKNYNTVLWENTIEDISKKAYKYPLKELEYIGITQNELDIISALNNLKYKKLLFTMLCYAKYHNTISNNNNGWVNSEIKELYRVSRVTVKHREDKFLYLNDLENLGLIQFSNKNDNLNLRITFIDNGKPVLMITDFRELGYEYLNYIRNGKFIRCEHCGRLVRKKSAKDFSSKYCNECAAQVQFNQKKQWDILNR